jgi:hypothetical protein
MVRRVGNVMLCCVREPTRTRGRVMERNDSDIVFFLASI